MAGIGDLVAHLGLDNSGFKKGLTSSRSMLSSFAGGMGRLLSPVGAAFAGVAGVAGIGLLVKNSFEGVDALAKFGQKLGITADQAAGFQHAAELSGVSADQLSAAMQGLSRNGLDIFTVADEIAAIEDPAQRSAYAFKVLGKSGSELIPLLAGGSRSLREMVAEGSKLSGLVGLDTAKVEAANDAISRSKAAFVGVANIVAVELAPAVEWAAIQMQGFVGYAKTGVSTMRQLVQMGKEFLGVQSQLVVEQNKWKQVGLADEAQIGGASAAEEIQHLKDEIALLNGETTKAQLKVRDLLNEGVSEQEAFQVGGLMAMREATERAIQERERLAEEARREAMFPGADNQSQPTDARAALAGSQEAASIMLRGIAGKSMEQIAAKQLAVQQQTLIAIKANKPMRFVPLSL